MPPIDIASRGRIFRVPPDAVVLQHDPWWHWYILLGTDVARAQAVMIYGTGSEEEHNVAPPLCLDVQPPPAGPEGTGVTKWTHFTPPAIMRVSVTHLIERRGELPSSWITYVAAKARDGIGFGSRLGISQGVNGAAHRGKIVRLTDYAKSTLNTRFALLLTPHVYSGANRYHSIVPLYDTRRATIAPDPAYVQLDAAWAPRVTKRSGSTGFYAAPELITSVWAPRCIDAIFSESVSETQLRTIEQSVFDYLDLTLVPAIRPTPAAGLAAVGRLGSSPTSGSSGISGPSGTAK